MAETSGCCCCCCGQRQGCQCCPCVACTQCRRRCGDCCAACRSCCLECWRRVWWRVKIVLTKIMAFMFSHVGLCGLVAGYAVLGAFIFREIELPEEMRRLGHIKNDTEQVVQDLLRYTKSRAVIRPEEWRRFAEKLLRDYEFKLVYAMTQEGYDGNDDNPQPQWTLSGGLLYSIAVFTTIGYGNIVPKTKLGRLTTVLYATIGIPLMLLCLANIAETLAQIFTFMYFKVCCAYCRWKKRQRRLKRAAMSIRNAPPGLRRGHSVRSFPSSTKVPVRRVQSVKSAPTLAAMSAKRTAQSGIDAKSLKNYRSAPRSFHDAKWDTRSLPGGKVVRRDWDTRSLANRRGISSRSPAATAKPEKGYVEHISNPATTYHHAAMKVSQKGIIPRSNKFPDISHTQGQKAHGCASCTCAQTTSAESPMSDTEHTHKDIPIRYVNAIGTGRRRPGELDAVDQTGESGEKANSPQKPSTSSTSSDAKQVLCEARGRADRGKTYAAAEGKGHLPRIVVSTNDREDMGQATASEDEEVIYAEEEISRAYPVETMIMLASEERSTGTVTSRRSDEASLKSARRAGSNFKRERMPVSVGILIVVFFIAGGSILFAVWEKWNVFDGAYFAFITLTTIGFGDLVPGRSMSQQSQEKLIICSVYLLFGMALIAMCFKLMQDTVVQRTVWLGQKIGLLVKEESSDSELDFEDEGLEEDEADNSDKTDDKRTTSSAGSTSRRDDERKGPRKV